MTSYRAWQRVDYPLLIAISVIVVFGFVMLSSASSVVSFQQYGDANTLIKKQLISGLIGAAACLVLIRIDYHYWKRLSFSLLIASIALLILVFIPGIGQTYLGARRWIDIGIQFQPTEIIKLTFLIYLASWFEQRGAGDRNQIYGIWPLIIILGFIGLLIIAQPDLGTLTVITLIAVVTYFIAGAPLKHFAWLVMSGIALMLLIIKIAPYRAARFTVFLNPQLDPQGIGYHINQSLLAIGSGGIFGLGLGHSRQKFNYLPEAHGDSIFAVLAEELGFITVGLLIAAFLFFMIRGFKIARNSPDKFGRMLATGITAWFTFQAFINIGALSGILPLTGIPLPFISYGGSSLIISLAAAGILLNISRQGRPQTSPAYH